MRHTSLRLIVAAAIALAAPAAAGADEIADLARQAETLAKAGKHAEAYETLKRALVTLAAATPITIRKSLFVTEAPKGFGIYTPRAENVFKAGEPLIAYVEPVGFVWQAEGDAFKSLMTVDFEIRDPAGKVLAKRADFGRFAFTSRERNQEIMTHLTLDITGAPAGDYVFGVTYHDRIGNKAASFDLPFKIR